MPTDSRIIAFTESELKDALFVYCQATGRKLSDPGMGHLRIRSDANIAVSVEGHTPGNATVFDANDIAAALILYCRNEKIPLPRNATKSLKIEKGSIALCTVWESARARIKRQNE
jgi:two-component system chemotaxis response regulator CheY